MNIAASILLYVCITFSNTLKLAVGETVYHKVTHEVYFDVTIGGENIGRITIGLFGEDVPKTVKNFLTIATRGIDGRTYAGTKFHRVIPKFVIQGQSESSFSGRTATDITAPHSTDCGDIVNDDGTGSISIYGDHFPDENFKINHTSAGYVSMANFGKDTNGCQFFITTLEVPSLNGRYVVFGKVVDGQNLVHKIEYTKRHYYNERPVQDVRIIACGQSPVHNPYYVPSHPYTFWAYVKAIAPPLTMSLVILGTFQWIMNRLDAGCRYG